MNIDIVECLSIPRPLWSGKPVVGVVIVDYLPSDKCLLVDDSLLDKSDLRYLFCRQSFYDELMTHQEFVALNLPVYDKDKVKDILNRMMERSVRRPLNPFRW